MRLKSMPITLMVSLQNATAITLTLELIPLVAFAVQAALAIFVVRNSILRTLPSCANHAPTLKPAEIRPYTSYARHTLDFLRVHLNAMDDIWYPAFAKYNPQFDALRTNHQELHEQINACDALLMSSQDVVPQELQTKLNKLSSSCKTMFAQEETPIRALNRIVPTSTMAALEEEQRQQRVAKMSEWGHLWAATYLLASLSQQERAVFPPGVPNLAKNLMLRTGGWKFKRYANVKEVKLTPHSLTRP
jgi:hypothetical protein